MIALAFSPFLVVAQTGNTAKLKALNFDEADALFGKLALDAGMSWECCIEEKCDCTDLKDPWENARTTPPATQVRTMSKMKNATQAQKDMARFEQAILDGKGKTMLDASSVEKAFAKAPGYSLEAMKSRMDIYILSMDSETEDE